MKKYPNGIFLVDVHSDLVIHLDDSKEDAIIFEFPNKKKIEFAGEMCKRLAASDMYEYCLNDFFTLS